MIQMVVRNQDVAELREMSLVAGVRLLGAGSHATLVSAAAAPRKVRRFLTPPVTISAGSGWTCSQAVVGLRRQVSSRQTLSTRIAMTAVTAMSIRFIAAPVNGASTNG
jgi:hypothetical protein